MKYIQYGVTSSYLPKLHLGKARKRCSAIEKQGEEEEDKYIVDIYVQTQLWFISVNITIQVRRCND